jgi:hypothetical protein
MDCAGVVAGGPIESVLELHTEHTESLASPLTNVRRVLADAGCEYDRVYMA